MDKTLNVTLTVTTEEYRLLLIAFGPELAVDDICRMLLVMRAASETRRLTDAAHMSRRIRNMQDDRREARVKLAK